MKRYVAIYEQTRHFLWYVSCVTIFSSTVVVIVFVIHPIGYGMNSKRLYPQEYFDKWHP